LVDSGFESNISIDRLRNDKEMVKMVRLDLQDVLTDFKEELYIPTVNNI